MVKKETPPKKKLSFKTRLIIIAAIFPLMILVFSVMETSDETKSDELESDESTKPLIDVLLDDEVEETEEELYYKFNPPTP